MLDHVIKGSTCSRNGSVTHGRHGLHVDETHSLLVFPRRSQWHSHPTTAFWHPCISAACRPIVSIWPPMSVWIIWNWHLSEIIGAFKLPVEKCETDRRLQLAHSGLWNRERGWEVCWVNDEYVRMGLLGASSSCKALLNSDPVYVAFLHYQGRTLIFKSNF